MTCVACGSPAVRFGYDGGEYGELKACLPCHNDIARVASYVTSGDEILMKIARDRLDSWAQELDKPQAS